MRNKLTRMMMLSVAALGIIGCADKLNEDAGVDKITGDGSYVYMDVALALPTSSTTRSTTDEDTDGEGGNGTNSDATPKDYEFGYAYENDVRSMLLVLADAKNDNYITHAVVSGITQWPDNDPLSQRFNFSMTQKFSRQEIVAAYDNTDLLGGDSKKVNVYAFCNYTADLLDNFKKYAEAGTHDNQWLNWKGEVVESGSKPGESPVMQNSIWSSRSFLMSNSSVREAEFPATPGEWNQYTKETTPFPLTEEDKPVYVERTAARFDYKDGSDYASNPGENNENLYRYDLKVKTGQKVPETTENGEETTKDEELNLISVQLTRMALVNMSKEYYYLRRVSLYGDQTADGTGEAVDANGTKNPKVVVGGAEKQKTEYDTNYVIDTDWKKKMTKHGINTSNADENFNFPLFKKTTEDVAENDNIKKEYNFENWYADNIADVLGDDKINDTWEYETGKTGSYKIWRYVTENTIPAPIANQKTVQSVGIVFKAAIVPGKDIAKEMKLETGEYRYISEEVEKALQAAQEHLPKGTPKDENDKTVYDYPTLYFHNNILYAGVKGLVVSALEEGTKGQVYGVLNDILSNWVLDGKIFKHKSEISQIEDDEEADEKKPVQLTAEIWADINGIKPNDDPGQRYYADYDYTQTDEYHIELSESDSKFKELVINEKITIYEASNENMGKDGQGWGYYCYYFYWNRHNSNNNASIMVPMEFATVRNNVYKLSVTKIGELGHPNIPANDPDPVDPEDPDEEDKVYMNVKVEVLPWVVRVNDIEF